MTTDRASCWSITINNPTEEEVKVTLPSGWKLSGQYEMGENETKHFQGMLNTPQIRFSAVKKLFPRAHIEIARNKTALSQYVNKEETRIASFGGNESPSIFKYQDIVADIATYKEFEQRYTAERLISEFNGDMNKAFMAYIDSICMKLIAEGAKGLEFISINPIWRSSWIKFWPSILERRVKEKQLAEINDENKTTDII